MLRPAGRPHGVAVFSHVLVSPSHTFSHFILLIDISVASYQEGAVWTAYVCNVIEMRQAARRRRRW